MLSIITDNNRINRNMFEELCGETLQSSIKHPFSGDQLFLLFDTVHILKSVRNNWLNQKFPSKEMMRFPSFELHDTIHYAKLGDLKKIYECEKALSSSKLHHSVRKSFFQHPLNDRMSTMQYAVRLFDEKNISALNLNADASEGTGAFLQLINKWWNIVTVKFPSKGLQTRNDCANPVFSSSDNDKNLSYLQKFVEWLTSWEELPNESEVKFRNQTGKLSKETHFSLRHTPETLVKLCDYLIENFNVSYVLLGKFQTDNLESRFGIYRQMCGANYNVSVRPVLEAERKLKIVEVLKIKSASSDLRISSLNCSGKELEDCDSTFPNFIVRRPCLCSWLCRKNDKQMDFELY